MSARDWASGIQVARDQDDDERGHRRGHTDVPHTVGASHGSLGLRAQLEAAGIVH